MEADLLAISPGDGRDLVAWLEALAQGGLAAVLLREPEVPEPRLHEAVLAAQRLGMSVAVHERCPGAPALARRTGTILHVRAGSPVPAQPFAASTHDRREVQAALGAGAVYVLLSPVWRPSSKPQDEREPLGLEAFLDLAGGYPPRRVLALGGVSPERMALLRAHGAGGAVLGPLSVPTGPELVAHARRYDPALRF
jgi:thiamine monophosphate synthase